MIIGGLDTIGIIFLCVAIAIFLTWTLWNGWNMEFTKTQFAYLTLVLILFGMFIMSWLRETGDELLIMLGLFVVTFLVIVKWAFARRSRRRRR